MRKILIVISILFIIVGCSLSRQQYRDKLSKEGIEFTRLTFVTAIKYNRPVVVRDFIGAGIKIEKKDIELAPTEKLVNLLKKAYQQQVESVNIY